MDDQTNCPPGCIATKYGSIELCGEREQDLIDENSVLQSQHIADAEKLKKMDKTLNSCIRTNLNIEGLNKRKDATIAYLEGVVMEYEGQNTGASKGGGKRIRSPRKKNTRRRRVKSKSKKRKSTKKHKSKKSKKRKSTRRRRR